MQVKIRRCTSCRKEKYITQFYTNKGSFEGIRRICKFCQSIQAGKNLKKRSKKVFMQNCKDFVLGLEFSGYSEKLFDEKVNIFCESMLKNHMGFRKYTPTWSE